MSNDKKNIEHWVRDLFDNLVIGKLIIMPKNGGVVSR